MDNNNKNGHLPKPMESWEAGLNKYLEENGMLKGYRWDNLKSFIQSQISQAKTEGFKEGVERCLKKMKELRKELNNL